MLYRVKSNEKLPHGRQKKRILIFCGDDAAPISAANIYAERLKDHELRFVEEKILSFKRIGKFSQRRFLRLGLFSLLDVYLLYAAKFFGFEKKARKQYTPSLVTANISDDPAVAELMAAFKPDLIIVGFCALLAPEFLHKAGPIIYNTHVGINPRYRGFGNIWAFYENDFATTGYTIHQVDAGIDTGKRLAVAPVCFDGIPFAETETYVATLAARHMAELVLGQIKPSIPAEFEALDSRYYGVPGLSIYRAARKNYNRHLAERSAKTHGAT